MVVLKGRLLEGGLILISTDDRGDREYNRGLYRREDRKGEWNGSEEKEELE